MTFADHHGRWAWFPLPSSPPLARVGRHLFFGPAAKSGAPVVVIHTKRAGCSLQPGSTK